MAVDRFPDLLLHWYAANARTIAWRQPPGSRRRPDAYPIWLAEIMAQQTRVAVAVRYWQRFVGRWPTVEALALADEREVLREWAGLGYYARARNLMTTARIVAAAGGFPENSAALRKLPGIGPYTAAAIASIAFGERVAAVDGNAARIAARLFAIDAPPPALQRRAAALLAPFVPEQHPGDFNQALMDLGATLCTPGTPDCAPCPLAGCCAARQSGETDRFPVAVPKRPRPRRQGLAWWVEHDNRVALTIRPERGLLGGMPGLPGTGWTTGEPDSFPFEAEWAIQPFAIRHIFTHFELTLRVAKTSSPKRHTTLAGQQLVWVERSELGRIGLPSLYRRVAEQTLAAEAGAAC